MKNLQILTSEANALINETSFFIVNTKEDNFENVDNPNYSESKIFENLEEAFDYFSQQVTYIETFETESEYKEVELILNDENDVFEVLDSEKYEAKYSKEDYGKYILHYLPKNNGISVSKIEIINENTQFYVNEDKRFSIKSEICDTKQAVIEAIYHNSLYISKAEAEEIFELFLN